MFSTNQGKFALSNAAMKLAARRVASNPDQIEAAVRAAMWHDASAFFGINNRFDENVRYEVIAPMTWVSGCTGSGKTELMHAASRDAARAGAQVVTLSGYCEVAHRWHEDDRAILDLRDHRLEGSEMERFLRRCEPYLIIALPIISKCHPDQIAAIQDFIEKVFDKLSDGMVLVTDEVVLELMALPHLIAQLRKKLAARRIHAMISMQERNDFAPYVVEGDAEIIMRGIDHTDFDGALPELIEGEGFLVQNGKVTPVLSDYEFTYEPMHVFPAKAQNVVERLKTQLSGGGVVGHIRRLDAVARACGYRDWHAAQGRRY